MMKMQEFYDKTLASLKVEYSEDYFDTSYGKTHCLLVGDTTKPRICTMQIDSPHLPPEDVMIDVCNKTVSFFKQST